MPDVMPEAVAHHARQPQEGLAVKKDRIVARFEGEGEAISLFMKDGHRLRTRLYPGDNLAPLASMVGLEPVVLRLQVYPSAKEPVALERIRIGFKPQPR